QFFEFHSFLCGKSSTCRQHHDPKQFHEYESPPDHIVQTNSEEKLNMQCPKRGLESVRSRASFAGQLALLFMGERWLSFNVLSAWNVLVRYWHENFTHVWRLRRVRRNGVLEGIEQIVQSNF